MAKGEKGNAESARRRMPTSTKSFLGVQKGAGKDVSWLTGKGGRDDQTGQRGQKRPRDEVEGEEGEDENGQGKELKRIRPWKPGKKPRSGDDCYKCMLCKQKVRTGELCTCCAGPVLTELVDQVKETQRRHKGRADAWNELCVQHAIRTGVPEEKAFKDPAKHTVHFLMEYLLSQGCEPVNNIREYVSLIERLNGAQDLHEVLDLCNHYQEGLQAHSICLAFQQMAKFYKNDAEGSIDEEPELPELNTGPPDPRIGVLFTLAAEQVDKFGQNNLLRTILSAARLGIAVKNGATKERLLIFADAAFDMLAQIKADWLSGLAYSLYKMMGKGARWYLTQIAEVSYWIIEKFNLRGLMGLLTTLLACRVEAERLFFLAGAIIAKSNKDLNSLHLTKILKGYVEMDLKHNAILECVSEVVGTKGSPTEIVTVATLFQALATKIPLGDRQISMLKKLSLSVSKRMEEFDNALLEQLMVVYIDLNIDIPNAWQGKV